MERSNRQRLRILAMSVCRKGMRESGTNPARIILAQEAIDAGRADRSSCVLFPAGYVCGVDEDEAYNAAANIVKAAKSKRIAVVVGADVTAFPRGSKRKGGKRDHADLDEQVESGTMPFYVMAWSPGGRIRWWRQRSYKHGRFTRDADERRVLRVGAHDVDVVICGEMFNRAIRDALAAQPRSSALLLPVHCTKELRFARALQFFAEQLEVSTVMSAHQANGGGHAWLHGGSARIRNSPIPIDADGQRAILSAFTA
jgi:hypothetical protein